MADQGFSGTVVGGIQDISALLPLLGTEQCEEHVGSALEKGFLYSSVSPLSIFGSLGIVRAGFNILMASITIRKFKFLGAKELKNGGFNLKGDVAPMIGFDQKHPRRFLAESQLETMLAEEHIQNAEDLTVSCQTGIFRWNMNLLLVSIVLASPGLLPYIALIHGSERPNGIPLIPTGWGFPIMRVLGSAACVIVLQLLIQLRILVILKSRLLFMTIDRYSLDTDTRISSLFSAFKEKNKHLWNVDLASETCIWELERWLFASGPREGNQADVQSAEESGLNLARRLYESESSRHFGSKGRGLLASLKHVVLSILLIASVLSTIGGYIGCFYLIQHTSEHSSGPLLWLGLEAALSVIRIVVWALNPSWDDSNGLVFELELVQHPPLITCTDSQSRITAEDGFDVVPVTRPEDFLTEVVAFTGPLKLFKWDNVKLYYVLAADDSALSTINPGDNIHGNLYIVVSNYEEQTTRLLRKDRNDVFQLFICNLVFRPNNTTTHVKVDFQKGITERKTHSFTADERAMQELESHYNEVISLLANHSRKRDSFGKSWSMRQPLVKEQGPNWLVSLGRHCRRMLSSTWQGITAPFPKAKQSKASKEFVDVENGEIDGSAMAQPALQKQVIHAKETSQIESTHGISPSEDTEKRENSDGNGATWGARGEDESERLPLLSEKNMRRVYLLSREDKAYLEQARQENRWINLCSLLEKWVELYTNQYANEVEHLLLNSTSGDKYGSWAREIEILQSKLLATYCLLFLEYFLEYTFKQLYYFVETSHKRMVEQVLMGTFGEKGERHGQEIRRKRKLKDRLEAEWTQLRATEDEKKAQRSGKRWSDLSAFSPTSETIRLKSLFERAKADLLEVFKELKKELEESDLAAWHDVRDYVQFHLADASQQLGAQDGVRGQNSDEQWVQRNKMDALLERSKKMMDRLFYSIQNQQKEFRDVWQHVAETLDEVPGPGQSVNKEQKYWVSEALEERLRLLHRREKYLPVFGEGIKAIGGIEFMVRALTRSQAFIFIDFTSDLHETCQEWTAQHIVSVVEAVPSITGVFYLDKQLPKSECDKIEAAINKNVQASIEAKYSDVCSHSSIEVGWSSFDDTPRYLISNRYNKSSSITVTFWTLGPGDHLINVTHNSRKDTNGVVHITLNNHSLDCVLEVSEDKFVNQDIRLPAIHLNPEVGGKNEFQIAFLRKAPIPKYPDYEDHDFRISNIMPVRQVEVPAATLYPVPQQQQSESMFNCGI